MDFLIPRNTAAEVGKDPQAQPHDRPAEALANIGNHSAVEFVQALALATGQPPSPEPKELQSATADTETGDESAGDPVASILETWSGITASLRTDPTHPDDGDMIPPETAASGQAAGEQATDEPALPERQPSDGVISHFPTEAEIVPLPPRSVSAKEIAGSVATAEGGTADDAGDKSIPNGTDNTARLVAPDARKTVIAAQEPVRQTGPQSEAEAPAIAKRREPAPHATTAGSLTKDAGFSEAAVSATGQKAAQPASGISDLVVPSQVSGPHAPAQGTLQLVEPRTPAPVAAPILRQITDAVVTMRDEMVEIRLSPEELGRVRMVLTGHDRIPHLTIWAERPDVLEQMRRNADTLLQQFNEEGLSDAVLNFRDGRRDQTGSDTGGQWQDDSEERDRQGVTVLTDMGRSAPIPSMRSGSHRVDVRM